MDKSKYIKWYKIARETVNDDYLIPNRTDEEIKGFVSHDDWLMFANEDVLNKEKGKCLDKPNVFFVMPNNPAEEDAEIGLTFDNIGAVDKIKNILSGYCQEEKEKLIKKLLSLESVWSIVVQRKIKDKTYDSRPDYITIFSKKSNEINEKIIDEVINKSDTIRREGKMKREEIKSRTGKYYCETPQIDLMRCGFELNEENFKRRVKEVFDVLRICLNVKSDIEIKKIKNEEEADKEKRLERIKNEIFDINNKIKTLEYDKDHGVWSSLKEEQYNNLKKELDPLRKMISNVGVQNETNQRKNN